MHLACAWVVGTGPPRWADPGGTGRVEAPREVAPATSLRFLVLDRMLGMAEHLCVGTKAAEAKMKQEEEDGIHQEVKEVRPQDQLKARDPW